MKKLAIAVFIILAFIIYQESTKAPRERVSYVQTLPEQAPFEVSDAFDGKWEGRRFDVSGDKICLETRILGEIENGQVSLRLMYNNTMLKGWISDEGKLSLYSDNARWGYDFQATQTTKRSPAIGRYQMRLATEHGKSPKSLNSTEA
ncbi:hypothetical protein [Enterovibrio coralii]|uniref:hypothetical protein n=1 Tax=Enterovibrio coralii TaxID=294935 RepID=UPI000AF2961C|nr:hypothetical protein [Enterovibrio coralii]